MKIKNDLKTLSDFILDPAQIAASREGQKKTYIIAYDSYRMPSMRQFTGTYRELLLDLLLCYGPGPTMDGEDGWMVDGRIVHNESEMTDAELENLVNDANGDDQPAWQVWCVEDRKQVL